MKTIFTPNGISSSKVIMKLAKDEFGKQIKDCTSYVELKREIISALRKLPAKELEENRLDTLVGIKHLEENDFGNFVSVRLAYWGMIIAIATLLVGDRAIYEYFNMTKVVFGRCVMIALTILLITMSRTIHKQHDQLEYLNFKLICFDELQGNRRK